MPKPIESQARAEQQRARRLQMLAEVGRKTTAILSREELLTSAVHIVRETFSYFMVNIFLVEGDELVLHACTMLELQKALGNRRLRIGKEGITGWVAANNRPLNVPDVRQDPRYSWKHREELATLSELAVPITLQGVVSGVLDVASEQVGAFTDLDVFTLQTVADQLAIAIENARLYGELRRQLAVRERTEALLRSLHAAGLAMEMAPTPEEVFVTVGRELERIGFSCTLALVDPDLQGGLVTTAYDSGESGRAASGPGSKVALGGVDAYRRIAAGEASVFAPGSLVAPLLFEHRLLGFLSVRSPDLAEEAIPALRVFANEIAAAWRKAQLVRDLEDSLRQLRHTQEQLLQSQKMEAVGRLAGGVAHDFNNQLTAILGYAEILRLDCPPGDSRREGLEEILKAARRAANLTQQLLAFSRKQVLQPRVVDLNVLLEDMRGMLQPLIGEDVRLEARYGPGSLRVRADPTQIQQVIANLAVNSRDAMPSGGTIYLSTSSLRVEEASRRDDPAGLPAGEYCLLAVRDTGTGMDLETQSRLFEPFFTTKAQGKGTGLGLSTVYGIVKQSGGHIFCSSRPGQGTTFTIYLPKVDQELSGGGQPMSTSPMPGGTETILVVEDERPVRELVRRVLASAGYTVHTAATGTEGLRLLEAGREPFQLVVTDLLLPGGLSGLELALRVLAAGRGPRLLCISGYSEQLSAEAMSALPTGSFLQKPFRPSELLRQVRAILDAR